MGCFCCATARLGRFARSRGIRSVENAGSLVIVDRCEHAEASGTVEEKRDNKRKV